MARSYRTFSFQPGVITPEGTVKVCENLRLKPDGTLATAYPPGVMMEGCSQWKFLGTSLLSDGSSLVLLCNSCSIGVKYDDCVVEVGKLPSEPRCITFDGDDVVISTDKGMCRLHRMVDDVTHEDSWTCTLPSGELPGLHFTVVDRGIISVPTEGVTFAKSYEKWGSRLAIADIRSLSASLKEAYLRLTSTIADAGDFSQPVAVRYKLRDINGKLLFTGPVTVITAQGRGWQGMDGMTARVHADSDGYFTHADSMSLSMRRFTLAIDLPGNREEYETAVDGIYAEVYVLPQLHPFDASTNAEYRLSTTPGEEAMTVWLPGATLGRAPLTSRLTRNLMLAPAYMEQHEIKIATITHPFTRRPRRVEIPIPDSCSELHRTASDDNAAWRAMSYKVATDSEMLGIRLGNPHSFSAGCVCRSGRNVVWGNIRRTPFKGFDLNSLSTGDITVPVTRASIRVTLTGIDGKEIQVVRDMSAMASDGLFIASDTLSPMVMYPDPSASLIEVRIERQDGSVGETSIHLTPSADRRCAISLSPSLSPLTLTATDIPFAPYTADNASEYMPSTTGIANPATPDTIIGALDCCNGGSITNIIPAWQANASWDYGAGRFYIMASSGIYGLAADCTAVNRMKSSLIDPRGSVLSHCAVMTPHGVAALAGGDLILLKGTHGQTLLHYVTASAIGYSNSHDELWLPETYGVTICQLTHGASTYRRPDINIRSLLQTATEILMIDDVGRMRVSSTEDMLADVQIRWEGHISHPIYATEWLDIDMEGDNMDLSVILNTYDRVVSRAHITGSMHHQTGLRIIGPIRDSHRLLVAGTVRGSFIMRRMTLRFNDKNPVSGFL